MSRKSSKADRINILIDRAGGQTALAAKSGIDRKTIGTYRSGDGAWKETTLRALADAVGVDLNWLLTGVGHPDAPQTPFSDFQAQAQSLEWDRDEKRAMARNLRQLGEAAAAPPVAAGFQGFVPVLGHAAGSIVDRKVRGIGADAWVRCPPALEEMPGVYARRVSGSSMAERWRDGDIIFACENMEPARGQYAVFEVAAGAPGRPVEILFKQYLGRNNGLITTRQTNPAANLDFAENTVRAMHRVFEVNELFGL